MLAPTPSPAAGAGGIEAEVTAAIIAAVVAVIALIFGYLRDGTRVYSDGRVVPIQG